MRKQHCIVVSTLNVTHLEVSRFTLWNSSLHDFESKDEEYDESSGKNKRDWMRTEVGLSITPVYLN